MAVQVATMALSSGLLHSFHVHNIVLAAALAPHSARGVLALPSAPLALPVFGPLNWTQLITFGCGQKNTPFSKPLV